MDATLVVPRGTDISLIRKFYPDLEEDDWGDDDTQTFWNGRSMDDDESDGFEWMTHDEAIEFCGFCEGAIPGADTLIEGNGGWAQGMLSRRDFSGFATTEEQKRIWAMNSRRYWAAHRLGRKLAKRRRKLCASRELT